eukprot:CAMPEP_0172721590 /NCGR_PEP_ID=MMETSP1074-20121228/79421_1 /TAXON_ID=2916 /ORGANISM="Ceratium fusus, Strain PA161109" /LENGTH=38 /DNA_ID= /DNA_START= /DNA_END= /DNA_ORIENTATION=
MIGVGKRRTSRLHTCPVAPPSPASPVEDEEAGGAGRAP